MRARRLSVRKRELDRSSHRGPRPAGCAILTVITRLITPWSRVYSNPNLQMRIAGIPEVVSQSHRASNAEVSGPELPLEEKAPVGQLSIQARWRHRIFSRASQAGGRPGPEGMAGSTHRERDKTWVSRAVPALRDRLPSRVRQLASGRAGTVCCLRRAGGPPCAAVGQDRAWSWEDSAARGLGKPREAGSCRAGLHLAPKAG